MVIVIRVPDRFKPRLADGLPALHIRGKVGDGGRRIVHIEQVVSADANLQAAIEYGLPAVPKETVGSLEGVAREGGEDLEIFAGVAETHGGRPGDAVVIPHRVPGVVRVVIGDGAMGDHEEEIDAVGSSTGIAGFVGVAALKGGSRVLQVEVEVDRVSAGNLADEVATGGVDIDVGRPAVLEAVLTAHADVHRLRVRRTEEREQKG